jgi:hypothetical protein
MSFVKISSMVINPRCITKIMINSSEYHIHLNSKTNWSIGGSAIIFWGNSDDEEVVKICSKERPEDYELVSKWIKKNT